MQQTMPDVGIIKHALKLACRAPSIHNSQPWHWALAGDALQLFVDRSRRVDIADNSGREAILSCGTTLDHLRVAMAASGWQAQIDRFPVSDDRDHLATVRFRPLEFVSEIQYKRAEAILERRTDRLPLRPPQFWASFVPELRRTIGDGGTVMLDVLSNEVRPQLASASVSSKILRYHDPSYQAELQWWTAPFALSMGIPPDALPSSAESFRVDVARDFPAADESDRRSHLGVDWSTILALSTGGDTRTEVLHCGEVLSTVLLECTVAGMATCTLTHLIEIPESRDIVRALVGEGREPQVLIRVGTAPPMEDLPAATPRLPLDEVLEIR
jgi:nitroreductase